MTTVTGFTAARSQLINDTTIVDSSLSGNNLILTARNGSTINAGDVKGIQGAQGPASDFTTSELNALIPSQAAWSSAWTPAVTGNTTAPNFGTGKTVIGKYAKVGRIVFWRMYIKCGGTGISAGLGDWKFDVPITPTQDVATFNDTNQILGQGKMFSSFQLDPVLIIAYWNTVASCMSMYLEDGHPVGSTWGLSANGNFISIGGSYESLT